MSRICDRCEARSSRSAGGGGRCQGGEYVEIQQWKAKDVRLWADTNLVASSTLERLQVTMKGKRQHMYMIRWRKVVRFAPLLRGAKCCGACSHLARRDWCLSKFRRALATKTGL